MQQLVFLAWSGNFALKLRDGLLTEFGKLHLGIQLQNRSSQRHSGQDSKFKALYTRTVW